MTSSFHLRSLNRTQTSIRLCPRLPFLPSLAPVVDGPAWDAIRSCASWFETPQLLTLPKRSFYACSGAEGAGALTPKGCV